MKNNKKARIKFGDYVYITSLLSIILDARCCKVCMTHCNIGRWEYGIYRTLKKNGCDLHSCVFIKRANLRKATEKEIVIYML